MRTTLLAGLAALAFATGAVAQEAMPEAGSGLARLPAEAGSEPQIGALAQAAPQPLNRIYSLPREADVEVTGSLADARSCVGATMGQILCRTDEP